MRSLTAAASLSARPRLAGTASLLLGGIAACGFQPLALWPLTVFAVAAFIAFTAGARSRLRAFTLGWLFGVGHFTIGNWWIATAFTHQAEMPHWLGGVAVVLLSLYLAVFPALAAGASWQFTYSLRRNRDGSFPLLWFGLVFAAFWIIAEWMRAWVFTGFAWNPLGVVLLGSFETQGLAFLAKWIGTYGLSGLTFAIAGLLAFAVRSAVAASGGRRAAFTLASVAGLALLAFALWVPRSPQILPKGGLAFTLVQPDVRQEVLNESRFFEANFQKTAALTVPLVPRTRRVVFWPESGLPDYLRDGYPRHFYRQVNYGSDPRLTRERIGQVIGPYSMLLTGAVDLVLKDGDDIAARNSVSAIDGDGNLLAGYAKAHLVPYGEYLPLRSMLEPIGLRRLVAGTLDFWPGPGPRTIDFGEWGKAGMQICYEIIFSGQVVDPRSRPDYIFNPSNDGWFGEWGPPQHLAQARLRAIEEGLPVLRSTTTGISAVIDADGIVRDHIPRHQAGRIDGLIPPPHAATLFSRYGNALPIGLAVIFLLFCGVALQRFER